MLVSVAADGERAEVSARALGLWTAKTANFVTDELGLGPGDVVALRLPCHWQAWGWLLGARWAGVDVEVGPPGTPPSPQAAAVVATATDAAALLGGAAEVIALSLLPLAVPGPVPPGALDYDTAVRAHGDRFVPAGPVGPVAPAGPGTARVVDAAGAQRPAWPGELVLTRRMPADAGEVRLLESALAAGAALLLAPALTASCSAAAAPAVAAVAAEHPTLALVSGDDADEDEAALLPLLGA